MSTKWYGSEILANVRDALNRGVQTGARMVETEGNRLMEDSPASGRTYVRSTGIHTASAPGEPPAVDSGELINSSRVEDSPEEIKSSVIWQAPHAPYMEYGTQKIAPRPFAGPAVENKRSEIEDVITGEVRKVLK